MKYLFCLLLLCSPLALWAKPLVVAVPYPLVYVAEFLGGEDIQVRNLTLPGIDPHDYQPGLRTLAQASRADLFLYNSKSIEPWAERFSREVSRQGGRVFVAQSLFASAQQTAFDPHWWLDPLWMLRYADRVAEELEKIAPKAQAKIRGRLLELEQKLIQLDLSYQAQLKSCQHRQLLVGHDAFRYLAKRYQLSTFALTGISEQSKPSLSHMAQAVRFIQKNHLSFLFTETLSNSKQSQTIAEETHIKTLHLSTLGNRTWAQAKQHRGYFALMNQNLHQLALGLQCPALH